MRRKSESNAADVFARIVRAGIWGRLTDGERAVLACYYALCSETSRDVVVGASDIAQLAGVTVRTVHRANHSLTERGLINRAAGAGGRETALTTLIDPTAR